MTKPTTTTNSTMLRGFAILEAVIAAKQSLSVTDLVEILKLPKPTVHRLTRQLEQEGLLSRELHSKRFIAGHRLRDFALGVLSNSMLRAPRHAILQALSDEVQETCNITMLDGNQIIYFDRVECNWPVRLHLAPGSRIPLHCTASGKLFLALMPTRQRQRLLASLSLQSYTERTLASVDTLQVALKRIAQNNLGVDNEEFIDGMVAIAAPVFDREGKICATVAIHAPTVRKTLPALHLHVPALRRAASDLSASFE